MTLNFITATLFLVLVSSWSFSLGDDCTASDVFLRFRGHILPNNSYILYSSIGIQERDSAIQTRREFSATIKNRTGFFQIVSMSLEHMNTMTYEPSFNS